MLDTVTVFGYLTGKLETCAQFVHSYLLAGRNQGPPRSGCQFMQIPTGPDARPDVHRLGGAARCVRERNVGDRSCANVRCQPRADLSREPDRRLAPEAVLGTGAHRIEAATQAAGEKGAQAAGAVKAFATEDGGQSDIGDEADAVTAARETARREDGGCTAGEASACSH